MVFGVYRADLTHYFYEKIRGIEDARSKLVFTQRILVYDDHFSAGGSKSIDGTLATSLHTIS